jgi:hypothetical protein
MEPLEKRREEGVTFGAGSNKYAPCHKSCPLLTFEIVEKSDTFCGREHTYSDNCKNV